MSGKTRDCMEYSSLLTKEFLVENYINKGLSVRKVAELVGCSVGTVQKYLVKHKVFRAAEKIFIEIKGFYSDSDKRKMSLVVEHNPSVRIQMLFKEDLEIIGVL